MAVVHSSARGTTIDIAGSAWPTYKLDALVVGLVTCLVLVLITGSPQIAVLAAAALAAARWLIGMALAGLGERPGDTP
ncbi:hypothetical protein [Nocardia sp. NPDC047654]|uniref:hypothetical protein n=1 Tax=Nocardia sp. NPDC047654 TaxID=3364314 RepID=UPI00371627C7